MTSGQWLLPAVIDPPDTVCFQIDIPNDESHKRAFFGAIRELAWSQNWERDASHSAAQVARVWNRQIELAMEALRLGNPCSPQSTGEFFLVKPTTYNTSIISNFVPSAPNVWEDVTNGFFDHTFTYPKALVLCSALIQAGQNRTTQMRLRIGAQGQTTGIAYFANPNAVAAHYGQAAAVFDVELGAQRIQLQCAVSPSLSASGIISTLPLVFVVLEYDDGQSVPTFNCADVSDCLPDDALVQNILARLDTNEIIDQNQQAEIDQQAITDSDGNIYSAPPDAGTQDACEVANFIVARLTDYIDEVQNLTAVWANEQDAIQDVLDNFISVVTDPLATILDALFGLSPPADLVPTFISQSSLLIEWLYCNGADKFGFADYAENLTRGDEIADYIRSVAPAAWQKWVAIGQKGVGADCSSMVCADWCTDVLDAFYGLFQPKTFALGGSECNLLYDHASITGCTPLPNSGVGMYIEWNWPSGLSNVIRIELDYEWNYTRNGMFAHRVLLNDTEPYLSLPVPDNPGTFTRVLPFAGTLTSLFLQLGATNFNDADGSYANLTGLRVYGTGSPPPEAGGC